MKLIIIIGAGKGIGYGIAEKFGKEGFKVALISRNEENLKELTAKLKEQGITSTYEIADVSDEQSLKSTLSRIEEKEGAAEVILYNAAKKEKKDFLEQDWESIKKALDVSIGGALNLLKIKLHIYMKADKGKLLFTGGGLSLDGYPQHLTLGLGKAGLRNLVQSAQKYAKRTNVHIAQVTIRGIVSEEDARYNPSMIADEYWKLYIQEPDNFEKEIIY